MANIDINNVANYKSAQKKIYDIYLCMQPNPILFYNKLEQSQIARISPSMNRKGFLSMSDLAKLQQSNPNEYNMLSQCANSGMLYSTSKTNPFVLAGTMGEMWSIKGVKLQQSYNFVTSDGIEPINKQTLLRHCGKKGSFGWTRIRTKPDIKKVMACFVPVRQKGQIQTSWGAMLNYNDPSIPHGKGDFIIASMMPDGRPNLQDRWVVNGLVFRDTYNNRGWSNCLANITSNNDQVVINQLPKLVSNDDVIDTSRLPQYEADIRAAYEGYKNYLYRIAFGQDINSGQNMNWNINKAYRIVQSGVASDDFSTIRNQCKKGMKGLYELYQKNPDSIRGYEVDILRMRFIASLTYLSKLNDKNKFGWIFLAVNFSFASTSIKDVSTPTSSTTDSVRAISCILVDPQGRSGLFKFWYDRNTNKFLCTNPNKNSVQSASSDNSDGNSFLVLSPEDVFNIPAEESKPTKLDSIIFRLIKSSMMFLPYKFRNNMIMQLRQIFECFGFQAKIKQKELPSQISNGTNPTSYLYGLDLMAGSEEIGRFDTGHRAIDHVFIGFKIEGMMLTAYGKHKGVSFDSSEHNVAINFASNYNAYLKNYAKIYFYICNVMGLSPFAFLLSRQYLYRELNYLNNTNHNDREWYLALKKDTFSHVKKFTGVIDGVNVVGSMVSYTLRIFYPDKKKVKRARSISVVLVDESEEFTDGSTADSLKKDQLNGSVALYYFIDDRQPYVRAVGIPLKETMNRTMFYDILGDAVYEAATNGLHT